MKKIIKKNIIKQLKERKMTLETHHLLIKREREKKKIQTTIKRKKKREKI